jgi:hypothetical protein
MPAQAFDFESFKALELPKYKTAYCKINDLKKAKGAIFLLNYTMGKATVKCTMIPFKKYSEATKAFKQLKKDKEHDLNLVGLASILVESKDNTNVLNVELKDGKLTAAKLLKKSKVFEEKTLKMPINIVTGIPVEEDDNTEEEQTTSSSEETATSDTTSTSKMSPEERTQHHKRLENLTAFFNKLANQ